MLHLAALSFCKIDLPYCLPSSITSQQQHIWHFARGCLIKQTTESTHQESNKRRTCIIISIFLSVFFVYVSPFFQGLAVSKTGICFEELLSRCMQFWFLWMTNKSACKWRILRPEWKFFVLCFFQCMSSKFSYFDEIHLFSYISIQIHPFWLIQLDFHSINVY